MNPEKSSHYYPETTSAYLQLVAFAIIREDPDPIDVYQLIVSAAKHFSFANRETLKKEKPYSLLVICDQNQGRSQIEEAILKFFAQIISIPLKIVSAGVNATPDKYGGKPGPKITEKMESLGIPMDNATVDQLKENDINENTILVALCAKENIPDHAFKAKVVIATEIEDKYPGSRIPTNKDSLDFLIAQTAWLAFQIITKLTEAIEKSDFKIFIKEFRNKIPRPSM